MQRGAVVSLVQSELGSIEKGCVKFKGVEFENAQTMKFIRTAIVLLCIK